MLNEEVFIGRCLDAVDRQTYPHIVEVLVIDGGSSDDTVRLAQRNSRVRILFNAQRIQAVALNLALAEAVGDIFVRIDGHCEIAEDYVACSVAALERTEAAMVGGAMTPVASGGRRQEGIARAMTSRLGAGPARFHTGGRPGRVDTVYLGAYRTSHALGIGGYAADQEVNEDAEFAYRMSQIGPIWFDPTIRSAYSPRSGLVPLARQFWRYGKGRAGTAHKHPSSLSPRQLVAPLLIVGLVSPWRRHVLAGYLGIVVAGSIHATRREPTTAPSFALALPAMHLPWGAGFLFGLLQVELRRIATRAMTVGSDSIAVGSSYTGGGGRRP